MRADLLPLSLLAACVFSGDPGPPGTAADVLDNLLADHLSAGGVSLGGATVSAVADDGAAAVLGATADGRPALWVFGARGGEPVPTELPAFSSTRTLLARAGDTWVVWACPGTVLLVRDGAREVTPRTAPGGPCPERLGASAGGDLLAGTFALGADGLAEAVTVDRFSVPDLADRGADQVPRGSADTLLRLGDDGDGPWLLGAGIGSGTLVWSGPAGLAELAEGAPRVAVRDGAAWRLAFAHDPALYRWSPASGAFDAVDRLEGEAWTDEVPSGLDGFIGRRATALAGTSVTTEAWWVAPDGDRWRRDALASSPCADPLECATIAEWLPVAFLPTAEGGWTVWSGWSWLGPGATVAVPAPR